MKLKSTVDNYQTMNKQLMGQMNMLRENEFIRERMAQREYDKMEQVTSKIQDKADSLSSLKNHLHNCCPVPAYPPPVYMTPRVETTKIIEKEGCCHTPRRKCHCLEDCHCGDESYIYLLPPINSRR